MLEKEAALLEGTKKSQIVGSKHKEVTSKDKERQQLSKKAKKKQPRKYCRSATVKMDDANSCERYEYWAGLPGIPLKMSN